MKIAVGTIALSAVLLLICPVADKTQVWHPSAPDPDADHHVRELAETAQTGPDLTLWQARRVIVVGLLSRNCFVEGEPGRFQFNPQGFELDATPRGQRDSQHYYVDLRILPPVFVKHSVSAFRVKNEAGKDLPNPLDKPCWDAQSQQTAELVANALNHLRDLAGEQGVALRDFSQAAAAWRVLATKSPIPEAVRTQRLLAETAFNERKLAQALVHYERGVELDPVWSEGRFNAALVAAQLEYHDEAVEQMRAYLELMPNAPTRAIHATTMGSGRTRQRNRL